MKGFFVLTSSNRRSLHLSFSFSFSSRSILGAFCLLHFLIVQENKETVQNPTLSLSLSLLLLIFRSHSVFSSLRPSLIVSLSLSSISHSSLMRMRKERRKFKCARQHRIPSHTQQQKKKQNKTKKNSLMNLSH